jgi:hypothetical protein
MIAALQHFKPDFCAAAQIGMAAGWRGRSQSPGRAVT